MGLYWWLSFLTCVSCCILSQAQDHEELMNDAPSPTEGSIHGFRPCLDESCSAESLDSGSEALTWHVLSALVRVHKTIHKVPDTEARDPDVLVHHCVPLHTSTVDRISSIEARHPDIKDIKMKVTEDFIRFVSDFALLNTTGCDSRMSLLSYMTLAIQSLQVEYNQDCGENCNCVYTADVEEHGDSASTTDPLTSSEGMDQVTSTHPPMGDEGYQTPCPEGSGHDSYEEVYAEDQDHSYGSSILVGSIRGVPGVNFPNYTDIPLTSFSCADKKYVPGFYADLETDCQVFHVCYEHRRESFLCPLGTIFNQPILACDYWYSSNCSLAKDYYEVNVKSEEEVKEEAIQVIKEIIEETDVAEEHSESTDQVYEEVDSKQVAEEHSESTDDVQEEVDIRQFLPVKATVIDFEKPVVKGKESVSVDKQAVQDVQEVASQIFSKIVSTATDIASKTKVTIDDVSEPDEMKPKPGSLDLSAIKLKPFLSAKKIAGVKVAAAVPAAKVAVKTAIPVAKVVAAKKVIPLAAKAAVAAAIPVAKVVTAKKVIPLAAKAAVAATIPAAKIAAVKTAVPVAAKVATVKTAIPIVAAKKIVPLASKAAVAAAVPKVKIAAVKTAIPIAAKASVVPVAAKAKLLAVPAKKVAISGVKAAAAVPKLAVPVLKAKILAPAMKGKVLKAAAVPILKAKILPVKGSLAGLAPVAKAKLVKTAAISPLTKKTLALGYMKLLKAKKLALMG